MSATTTFIGQARYKDQLKLMRAETAASWVALVVERLVGPAKSAPTIVDQDTPATRWYGAFY
jgi:hypothetical protein